MTSQNKEVPDGFVLLQRNDGKACYAACLDGGRFHGWLMWKHPDGQWVSKRKLESWEVMQAEDQRDYGIVQETGGASASQRSAAPVSGGEPKNPLATLHDELNRITWEGEDEGWNLAITAVQKRINEILTAPAPADVPRHPDFWRYEHIANGLRRRAEQLELERDQLRAAVSAAKVPTGAEREKLRELAEAYRTAPLVFKTGERGHIDIALDALVEYVAAVRPTDDHLWDETIRDRDTYHEWADKLAEAISTYFNAYIGEHSNMNCPWAEALEAIECAAPVEQGQGAVFGMRVIADSSLPSDVIEVRNGDKVLGRVKNVGAGVVPVADEAFGEKPYGYWYNGEWYGYDPDENAINFAVGSTVELTPVWTHNQAATFNVVGSEDSDDVSLVPATPADAALLVWNTAATSHPVAADDHKLKSNGVAGQNQAETAIKVAADDQVRQQAFDEAAALVINCDKRADLRGIAAAIRALKSRTTAHGGAQGERT